MSKRTAKQRVSWRTLSRKITPLHSKAAHSSTKNELAKTPVLRVMAYWKQRWQCQPLCWNTTKQLHPWIKDRQAGSVVTINPKRHPELQNSTIAPGDFKSTWLALWKTPTGKHWVIRGRGADVIIKRWDFNMQMVTVSIFYLNNSWPARFLVKGSFLISK